MAYTLDNRVDIYRETPIKRDSPEHVLQAGMGCSLEVVGLIDHATNNGFGGTIDKVLLEDFALVRAQLGLTTRRGESIRVESLAGDYDMRGDAPVQKRSPNDGPPWQVTSNPDGSTRIAVTAQTPERASELVRHAIRAVGAEGQEPIDLRVKSVKKYLPPIQFEVGLGGPAHLRAVAKTCFNYFGFKATPAVALRPIFSPIREYILHAVDGFKEVTAGAKDPFPRLACFDFRSEIFRALPADECFGPLDHRLVIRSSQSTGIVYATLELFGSIPYSVLLAENWADGDLCWALVADPRPDTQKFRQFNAPPDIRPELHREDVLSHVLDSDEFLKRTDYLFRHLRPIVDARVANAIVADVVRSASESSDGKMVTADQLGRLVREAALQSVRHIHRLDSETELPPTDI